jgi:hypothetical protein
MLDIKQEIQVLLLRKGLSMRKMIKRMTNDGLTKIQSPSFSRMLIDKTIRFELVQQILDYLGYELIIKPKS